MGSYFQPWQQQQQEMNQPAMQDQWDNNDSSLRSLSSGEAFSSLPASSTATGGSVQGYIEQNNKNASSQPSSSIPPPSQKPRARARRGQATDPHSIAERLRRERIADRMKALQELVPNSNKVDRAAMLDDIIEYVRFLQLQVKILGMNDADSEDYHSLISFFENIPKEVLAAAQESTGLNEQQKDLTERQVALLMEQDMVSAMQYLQSKGLCLLPVSLASSIFKQKENENENEITSHGHRNANDSSNSKDGGGENSMAFDLSKMECDGSNVNPE